MNDPEERVLVFCHSHYGPFADVVRQYSALFKGTRYKVTSVYLTGEPSNSVASLSDSDEVIFMNLTSSEVHGLKLRAIFGLRRILQTRNVKYIIAHRFKPIYISLLATKVSVVGVHHAFGDYSRWSHRFLVGLFKTRLTLIGISNAIRDDIRKDLPKWPASRSITFYNRIDVGRACSVLFPKNMARAALGLSPSTFVIANVGRLHPDKDQATLINAFSMALPEFPEDCCLVILGKGRLEDKLRHLVQKLGLSRKVKFLGQVTDVRRLFTAFDLFVLSSDREPFGMVLLEAFVARVPVLVSDCGGAPEVVADIDARFPFGNARALSQKLIEWSSKSPLDLARIAENNFNELHRRFSDEVARREFFNLQQIRDLSS